MPQVLERPVDVSQASDDILAEDAGMTIMTIIEVLITWGDQVLDAIVLAQMLRNDSPFGSPLEGCKKLVVCFFCNICKIWSTPGAVLQPRPKKLRRTSQDEAHEVSS